MKRRRIRKRPGPVAAPKSTIEELRKFQDFLELNADLAGYSAGHVEAIWSGLATEAIKDGEGLALSFYLERLREVPASLKYELVQLLNGLHSDWRLEFRRSRPNRRGNPKLDKGNTAISLRVLGDHLEYGKEKLNLPVKTSAPMLGVSESTADRALRVWREISARAGKDAAFENEQEADPSAQRRRMIRTIAAWFPHTAMDIIRTVEHEFADPEWVEARSLEHNGMSFDELLWRRTRFLAGCEPRN